VSIGYPSSSVAPCDAAYADAASMSFEDNPRRLQVFSTKRHVIDQTGRLSRGLSVRAFARRG
jgi:hypothetical protein